MHLDMNWLDHAFARNSFKLKNSAQIEAIKRLGIQQIRVEPARCSSRPLPLTTKASEHAEIVVPSAEENALISEKKARIERMIAERAAVPNVRKNLPRQEVP
ncbi:MAG: DUF3391 domain-containing protein [Simplicispira sp.]|nr:DUF3391 domain-containing protein [Simplicispira sp.]